MRKHSLVAIIASTFLFAAPMSHAQDPATISAVLGGIKSLIDIANSQKAHDQADLDEIKQSINELNLKMDQVLTTVNSLSLRLVEVDDHITAEREQVLRALLLGAARTVIQSYSKWQTNPPAYKVEIEFQVQALANARNAVLDQDGYADVMAMALAMQAEIALTNLEQSVTKTTKNTAMLNILSSYKQYFLAAGASLKQANDHWTSLLNTDEAELGSYYRDVGVGEGKPPKGLYVRISTNGRCHELQRLNGGGDAGFTADGNKTWSKEPEPPGLEPMFYAAYRHPCNSEPKNYANELPNGYPEITLEKANTLNFRIRRAAAKTEDAKAALDALEKYVLSSFASAIPAGH